MPLNEMAYSCLLLCWNPVWIVMGINPNPPPTLFILPPLSSIQVTNLCLRSTNVWVLRSQISTSVHVKEPHHLPLHHNPPPLPRTVSLNENRTLPLVGYSCCPLGRGLYDSLYSPTVCEGCAVAFPESHSTEGSFNSHLLRTQKKLLMYFHH